MKICNVTTNLQMRGESRMVPGTYSSPACSASPAFWKCLFYRWWTVCGDC